MDTAEKLRELSRNLYWTWHIRIVEIFRDIDPSLWRKVNHNPVKFLEQLPEGTLRKKATDLALQARLTQAFHRLQHYLEQRKTWGAVHAGPLQAKPVAYFSAEFGLHESLPIYSGGLGVLSGDHLKSASDLGIPLVGVGLFYARGYFNQCLDENGLQHEDYLASDVNTLPIDLARDEEGRPLRVTLTTRSSRIHAEIWMAHVGRNRLILLDSNVDENSDEDKALTATLYGGDERTRIRQEPTVHSPSSNWPAE